MQPLKVYVTPMVHLILPSGNQGRKPLPQPIGFTFTQDQALQWG